MSILAAPTPRRDQVESLVRSILHQHLANGVEASTNGRAMDASHRPNLVVLAGGHLSDDTVARWAYAVRLAAGAMPVAIFRRGEQRVRMRTTGTSVLPSSASDAQRRVLELIEAEHAVQVSISARHSAERSSTPRSATA